MPHVSFVTLAGFRICDPKLLDFGLSLPGFADRAQALAQLPALGLITLAGQIPDHWTCSYHSPTTVDESVIDQLVEEAPDLVAISALTPSVDEAYALCQSLKKQGITTVIGGLHVSACPDEAAYYADVVVTGSGEAVWPHVICDFEQRELRPRYSASRNQKHKPWVMPRFDLLGDVQRYTLQTQRGCPLACDFCAASRLIEQFREKPVELIRRELAEITKLRPNALVELADDNTFAGHRDPAELLDALQESGVRWFTEADWRIGERVEVLQRLSHSGCMQILTGLESVVFRYPGMAHKAVELNRMTEACLAMQEHGICVNACFIIGADGETEASIDRLTEFLIDAPFAEIQVTLQTPFPGTGLRQRLAQQDRLLEDRGWPYYSLFEVTYQPDALTVGQLEERFQTLVKHVYGPAATRRRKRIRAEVWKRNRRLRSGDSTSVDHNTDDGSFSDR